MNQPSFSFLGLGLIGGSIAKALKAAYPKCHIRAYDSREETLGLAQSEGIADEIFGMENSDYELRYDSADELANVMVNVLNSKKVIKVMQELIYAAQRIIKLDSEIEEQ